MVAAALTRGGNMQRLPLLSDTSLLQNRWKAIIDPVLVLPMLNGVAINGISLTASTPLAIPTTLNRMQQGWFIIDNNANANVWRTAAFNDLTLTLEASANTTISIWVF